MKVYKKRNICEKNIFDEIQYQLLLSKNFEEFSGLWLFVCVCSCFCLVVCVCMGGCACLCRYVG